MTQVACQTQLDTIAAEIRGLRSMLETHTSALNLLIKSKRPAPEWEFESSDETASPTMQVPECAMARPRGNKRARKELFPVVATFEEKVEAQTVLLAGFDETQRDYSTGVFAAALEIVCQNYLTFNEGEYERPAFLQLEMIRRAFPYVATRCRHFAKLKSFELDHKVFTEFWKLEATVEPHAFLRGILREEMVHYRSWRLIYYIHSPTKTFVEDHTRKDIQASTAVCKRCHWHIGFAGWIEYYLADRHANGRFGVHARILYNSAVCGALFGGQPEFIRDHMFHKNMSWYRPAGVDWEWLKDAQARLYQWPLSAQIYGPDVSKLAQESMFSDVAVRYGNRMEKYTYASDFDKSVQRANG